MKRIFSIVLLAVFLFSTTTVCYAADISSENDEDEVFDIFASDIDIPAFPSGYAKVLRLSRQGFAPKLPDTK